MKTVLLTGGYGFLGSHLLNALVKNCYNVIVLEKSFANPWRIEKLALENKFKIIFEDNIDLESIFKENRVDIVIHTATDYGRESKQYELINNNVIFPLKLLELLKKYKGEAFFNTDSYFNKPNTCMSYLGNYIVTKKQLEDWLKLEKDIKVFNMKLEHIYGKLDSEQKFVTSVYKKLKTNVKSIDLTDGTQKRDFINVKEVVIIFIKVLEKIEKLEKKFYDLEIGTGKSLTVKEFVENMKRELNSTTKLNFGALEMRKNEIMDSKSDSKKIGNLIGEKMKKLTLAIPTYNRPEILERNLLEILKSNSMEFEVTICDNSDNNKTKEKVDLINDKRIKYYKNNGNIGFYKNLIKVLGKSNGEYILTLSDEDYIDKENLEKLLYELNEPNEISLYFMSVKEKDEKYYFKFEDKAFNQKEDVEKKLFNRTYMSGVVMKKNEILELNVKPLNKYQEIYPLVLIVNNFLYNYKYKELSSFVQMGIERSDVNGMPFNYILPESRYEQLRDKVKFSRQYPLYEKRISLVNILQYLIFILNYNKDVKKKLGDSYYTFYNTPKNYEERLIYFFIKGVKLLKLDLIFQPYTFILLNKKILKFSKKK